MSSTTGRLARLLLLAGAAALLSCGDGGDAGQAAAPQQHELEALQTRQAARGDFSDVAEILAEYGRCADRWRGTVWEGRALQARAAYLDAVEARAKSRLEELRARGPASLTLYESFPAHLLDTTPTGATVKAELARLRAEAAGDRERQAVQSGAAREMADRYLSVESRVLGYLSHRDFRLAIGATGVFLFGPWSDGEKAAIHRAGVDYAALGRDLDGAEEALAVHGDVAKACALWSEVVGACEEGVGDPAAPAELSLAMRILLDLRNAVSLELFRHQALTGLDRLVRRGELVDLEVLGRGRFEARPGGLAFVRVQGEPVAMADPWSVLSDVDLAALAPAGGDGAVQLRIGLLYHTSRAGAVLAARAQEAFAKAAGAGIRGARIYRADVSADVRARSERDLEALHGEAVLLARRGELRRVKSVLEGLLRETRSAYVAGRESEIRQLLRDVDRELDVQREGRLRYGGDATALEDGRVRVRYDFSEAEQMAAFELMTLDGKLRGSWTRVDGGLESSQYASAVRWRHAIRGDATVEYSLTPLQPPQNVVTTLYFHPGRDNHYSLTFAFDIVSGPQDPHDELEDRMSVPRTCVIKYPVPFRAGQGGSESEWEALRKRLVGSPRNGPVPRAGEPCRVRVTRRDRTLLVEVNGAPVWEGEDGEYTEGDLLFYSDSRVRIDDLSITLRP